MKQLHMFAAAAACVVLTSGCATLTQEQCQRISPQQQGLQDGLHGVPSQQVDELIGTCQARGTIADVSQFKNEYLKAYQTGLKDYCQPSNAERVGLLGEPYHGVCPKEVEAPFLKEYLYALKQHNDAQPQMNPYVYYPAPVMYDPFWHPWYFFGSYGFRRHHHH